MTLLEIAVYVAVLSASTGSMMCRTDDEQSVLCTNGVSVTMLAPEKARLSTGTVIAKEKGGLTISDGTTVRLMMGWLQFSNGASIQRVTDEIYRFSDGRECRGIMPAMVECQPSKAAGKR